MLCSVIAAILHFVFLVAFSWMCLEGIQLYVMLVEVFEVERSRIRWYYAAGYGIHLHYSTISFTVHTGSVLRWDRGQLPPKPRLCPQMWHETLFDKLKTSAYRCKKERSVAFRMRFRPGLWPCWGSSRRFADPQSAGDWTPFPYHTHLAPSARRFSRLRRSPLGASIWPAFTNSKVAINHLLLGLL